ncbi:MAG: hypothetical protein WAP35_00685 [Solirubrobacterales bacterium]
MILIRRVLLRPRIYEVIQEEGTLSNLKLKINAFHGRGKLTDGDREFQFSYTKDKSAIEFSRHGVAVAESRGSAVRWRFTGGGHVLNLHQPKALNAMTAVYSGSRRLGAVTRVGWFPVKVEVDLPNEIDQLSQLFICVAAMAGWRQASSGMEPPGSSAAAP